jgi:hypothetical protein
VNEWLELRVSEEHADKVFAPTEGKRLGTVRRVRLRAGDPRLAQIAQWQRTLSEPPFFFGWDCIRRYTPAEIAGARAFLIARLATFEPEGESCGTVYDDADACVCGVPRRQLSALRLRVSHIPRGVHMARTIADEVVLSVELLRYLTGKGISIQTAPVFAAKGAGPDPNWRQLITSDGDLEINSTTQIGNGPFDADPAGKHRCPAGCVLGLNLLSELVLTGEGLRGRHLAFTRQCVGVRRGVLVPRPLIVVSPELGAILNGPFGRRCRLEVVYHDDDRAA